MPGPEEDEDHWDEAFDEGDEDSDAELSCGGRPDGTCDLGGTEWCDWKCPFSGSLLAMER